MSIEFNLILPARTPDSNYHVTYELIDDEINILKVDWVRYLSMSEMVTTRMSEATHAPIKILYTLSLMIEAERDIANRRFIQNIDKQQHLNRKNCCGLQNSGS